MSRTLAVSFETATMAHYIIIASILFIVGATAAPQQLPQLPGTTAYDESSMMDLLSKTDTGTAIANNGGGMFYIPKPTSTQKQQEKLTKVISSSISDLSSKTQNQTQKLAEKLKGITKSIDGTLNDLTTKAMNNSQQLEGKFMNASRSLNNTIQTLASKADNNRQLLENRLTGVTQAFEKLQNSFGQNVEAIKTGLESSRARLQDFIAHEHKKAELKWNYVVESTLNALVSDQFDKLAKHITGQFDKYRDAESNATQLTLSTGNYPGSKIIIL